MENEILAFINWLEINPLDAITQALWFHLRVISLKCNSQEWFTVANLTLQAKLNVDKKTLIKHRNILVQKGCIEYVTQGRQQAGKYKIIPLSGNFPLNLPPNWEPKRVPNWEPKQPPLNNNSFFNNNNDNTPYNPPSISTKFEQEFGRLLSPMEISQIVQWIDVDKYTEDIITEALRRAVLLGKHNFKYIDTILLGWKKASYKTLQEIQEKDPMGKIKPKQPKEEKSNNKRLTVYA